MLAKTLIRSFLAGISISIGGVAFLSAESKIVGALLFSVGLLLVCTFDQYLFTGKICFADKENWIWLSIILLGNYWGAEVMGIFIRHSRPDLVAKTETMINAKLAENWMTIPLGIMCNILIFCAVHSFATQGKDIGVNIFGRYLILIACVSAFIICGFEHCVANMFYFSLAGKAGAEYLALNVLGNTIGGLICNWGRRLL